MSSRGEVRRRRGWLTRLRYQLKRHPFLYRLRYALILRLGGDEIFRPPEPPSPFDGPAIFAERVAGIKVAEGTLAAAHEIARRLSTGHERGPGLGVDSVRALERIEAGGAGVCSDYTQVFLALCAAAGVPAREWGMCETFEGRGVGHAVAEVWATELDQWVGLDPFFSLYPVSQQDGAPLSLAELAEAAAADRADDVRLIDIDPEGAAGTQRDGWKARYLRPGHHFFLLVANDVFRQDRYLRLVGTLPIPAIHLLMLLAGSYQRFHLLALPRNRERTLRELRRLRLWLLAVAGGGLLFAGLATIGLGWFVRTMV